MKPKNFDGGHLTRTHKAVGHSVKSKASHSAWTIKCHLAFGWHVFDIHVLFQVYSSTCLQLFFVWVLPIWRQSGFKSWIRKQKVARFSLFLKSLIAIVVDFLPLLLLLILLLL